MYDRERSIKMAYGDVKQSFPKGLLNEYWYYIELSRLFFSEDETEFFSKDGTEASFRDVERIDQLKDSLIRYTILSPWPLPEGAEPETFKVRFFAKEHEDFYYYLGFGQGIQVSLQSDLPQESVFDLEAAITEKCLGRAPQLSKEEQRKKTLAAREDIITFLEAMGDTDKRSIAMETGASMELIEAVLRSLKKNGLLKVDKRGNFRGFDANGARKLLLNDGKEK